MTSVSPSERPPRHVPADVEKPLPAFEICQASQIPFPASRHHGQLKAPLSDRAKEPQLFPIQGQLQDQLPGMVHDPTGDLDQLPAKGGHAVMPKGFWTGEPLKPQEKMVGDHPDSEKDGMGKALPTRHPI